MLQREKEKKRENRSSKVKFAFRRADVTTTTFSKKFFIFPITYPYRSKHIKLLYIFYNNSVSTIIKYLIYHYFIVPPIFLSIPIMI